MKLMLAAAALFCSTAAWGDVLSYQVFTTPPKRNAPQVIIPGKTVAYSGFYIEQSPGSKWGIAPGKQRENFAFWAIVDAENILHTTIAMVTLSPQLSAQYLEKLSLTKLKEQIAKKFSTQSGSRFQNIEVSSRFTTINGVKFAEVCSSALDYAARHSAAKPLRLYTKILAAITPDGRIFTISVSERIPNSDGKPDLHATDVFIKSVKLGKTQE